VYHAVRASERTGKGGVLAGVCGRVLPGMVVAEPAPAAPSFLHPSIPDGICGAMGMGSAVGVSVRKMAVVARCDLVVPPPPDRI